MQLRIVQSIDSTNAELMRLPLGQTQPGTALLALTQSGGRGRSDRVWESPLGGMYLSVVLHPSSPQGLALLGAKAILRLLESYGLRGVLRWPNDVMLGGRKLGGVLPVARYQGNRLERAVLGVGLNVKQSLSGFPADLQGQITTLQLQQPSRTWDVPEVAVSYLQALEVEGEMLETEGLPALCRRCEAYLEGLQGGRRAVLVQPGQPSRPLPAILGLTENGALRLAGGGTLEALGREERLRFEDELGSHFSPPPSPHFSPPRGQKSSTST